MTNEKYYRYIDILWSENGVRIRLEEYDVIKHTRCGVWIKDFVRGKRFVNSNARKKFALPTKEEAKKSFIARKERQIRILEAQLDRAKHALQFIEEEEEEIGNEFTFRRIT